MEMIFDLLTSYGLQQCLRSVPVIYNVMVKTEKL